MSKKKAATHVGGAAVTSGSGYTYSQLVTLPFGFSSLNFEVIGPLAGYIGFEFGRWLGKKKKYKPIILIVFALLVVPFAFWSYDLLIHVASPSIFNSLFIFLLFSVATFSFGTAIGIIELKIENLFT
jgi:hypothetical protein